MLGVFSEFPPDTLAAALAPIASHCEQLDWVVDLYSGPLKYPYSEEDDPQNLLSYYRDTEFDKGWFQRGFLPKHASSLVIDEWGYYLGFDSAKLNPAELYQKLGRGWGLQPRPELLEAIIEYDLLYLFRPDVGWWEAYTTNPEVLHQIQIAWDGYPVQFERWFDGLPSYPPPKPD